MKKRIISLLLAAALAASLRRRTAGACGCTARRT